MERRLKTLKELKEMVFDWSLENVKSKDEIPVSYVMYSFENREFVEYIWNRVNSIFQKIKEEDGQLSSIDAEFYAFTGSRIMIDQAMNDFTPEDLPCPTVIQQVKGKDGKFYTKFT